MRLHLRLLSLVALLLPCSLAVTAQAGTIVVDTFDQGSQSLHAGGGGLYDTYSGPGPLGGDRFLYARNAHSQAGASRIDINNAESTPGMAKAWPGTASGASARTIGWGKSGSNFEADFSAGNELNLNFGDNGTIEIDVAEVIAPDANFPQLRIWANGGSEVFEYNLPNLFAGMQSATATPQTLTVQLNAPSFGTFNSGDLDNVDGIRLQWYGTANTVVSEVRATGAGISGVPEPSSFALTGLGLVGLAGWGLRRRRQA